MLIITTFDFYTVPVLVVDYDFIAVVYVDVVEVTTTYLPLG